VIINFEDLVERGRQLGLRSVQSSKNYIVFPLHKVKSWHHHEEFGEAATQEPMHFKQQRIEKKVVKRRRHEGVGQIFLDIQCKKLGKI
jgi:hypothetical protein